GALRVRTPRAFAEEIRGRTPLLPVCSRLADRISGSMMKPATAERTAMCAARFTGEGPGASPCPEGDDARSRGETLPAAGDLAERQASLLVQFDDGGLGVGS